MRKNISIIKNNILIIKKNISFRLLKEAGKDGWKTAGQTALPIHIKLQLVLLRP